MEPIRITCKAAGSLPLDAVEEFQGGLKKRSKKDIAKIRASIEKLGFTFPFFIWNGSGHNYCIDGHGRLQALAEIRESGADLPEFPVVYIDAKDEDEAKIKLLQLNSRYGVIDEGGLVEFIDGLDIDLNDFELDVNEQSVTGISRTQEEKLEYLIFGKNKIPVSNTEKTGLENRLNAYLSEFGINAGFVSRLLNVENNLDKGLFFSEK
jgi:hypothetical protein